MDWQKGGYQAFQIMWSTKPHNDCVPPLQLRSFTSDSYRAIKERERKRCQQKKAASKQWKTIPHSEARRESASLDAAVDALGSTSMELITDIELGSDSSQAMDLKQSSASAHEVDIIVPKDVDTPVEEQGSALLNETALASPTLSHPTPKRSCVASCDTEQHKQPMQDGDSASPHLASPLLASPQPNTVHVLAAATGPSRDELGLTMGLLDAQGHTCWNGYHGSRNYQAGFDQAGRISKERGLVPQALWTKDLDEYLLYLRNVAQLKWEDLVNYFPTITPIAIKRRHKQLSETKETTQVVSDQLSARFEERSTAAFRPASTPRKRQPKITKHHHATPGPPATSKLVKPCSPRRQRREARQTNYTKIASSPALATLESTPQHSSRCGRPIRHPFRNRPNEGYL